MGFMDDLAELMPDIVTAVQGAVDGYGDWAAVPSGAVLAIPCHIEGSSMFVRDVMNGGAEVLSKLQLYLSSYNDLDPATWRFYLPDRFSPKDELRALSIQKSSDELGALFEVVYL